MTKLSNELIEKISNDLFLQHFNTFQESSKTIELQGNTDTEKIAYLSTVLSTFAVRFAKDFSTDLVKEVIQYFESNE